ncbi:MAG: glycosyltransferase family 39 protein [Deltaproteobacteria bacterium]|nr:glycosyltransferase family 39 protein [Deltaproteobacteria bacterium]
MLIALVARSVVAAFSVDVPGDGPTRAIEAWRWQQNPHLVMWGVWPPGLTYLTAVVALVQPDPRWSVRILNVVAGTMTIPVFAAVARRIVAPNAAWLATASLALLPLHVELSVTSLTESTFILEILIGLWLVMRAREATVAAWMLGATALALAVMTRYDAWWFAPALLAAVASTGRWRGFVGLALAMGMFPVAWCVGNMLAVGDPLYGLSMVRRDSEIAGAVSTGLGPALAIIAEVGADALGLPLVMGVAVAIGIALRRGRELLRFERVVYVAVTGTFWIAITWFAMNRGRNVFDRYLVLGLVLLLPVAAVPWSRLCRTRRVLAGLAVVLALASAMPRLEQWPPRTRWITWSPPRDMELLTAWMRSSPYRDASVVLTEMGWVSTYFALLWPEATARRIIVSPWTTDYELGRFLERRPTLLVTVPTDADLRQRIERVGGGPMIGASPLRTFGALEVRVLAAAPAAASP